MVSCRFRIARATVVMAASSAGSMSVGSRRFADCDQLLAQSSASAVKCAPGCLDTESARICRSSASARGRALARRPSRCGCRSSCRRCSRIARANTRAASTKIGSFSRSSACSGVFEVHAIHGAFLARRRIEIQPGSDAGTCAATGCRRRAGRDRRRGWPNTRAWGNSAPPDSRRADTGFTLGPPNFSTSSPETGARYRAPLSASTRKRLCRASSRLSGSLSFKLRRRQRRLPIGVAGHDGADQVLHVPGMRACGIPFRMHELGRQPVEQFRMRRPFALRAEIVQSLARPVPKNWRHMRFTKRARSADSQSKPASSPDPAAWRAGRRYPACRGTPERRAARFRLVRPSSWRAAECA